MAGDDRGDRADVRLVRSTVGMTVATGLSRATGFGRVLVVAAVLGPTYLGNTYQSANTVPNLLFELLAAGALQAVLIPTLVEVLDRHGREEVERVAGTVLGLTAGALAAVAAAGMVAAPWLMRLLVVGVEDGAVRAAQVRLGTFFLWFFLPQVVLYAAGMVATAVLNARERFVLPVAAPIVNNVVVVGAYLGFWWLRAGRPPTLELSLVEKLVLAGGTTVAVLAFTSVPVVAAVRSGVSLRPRFEHRHPAVRHLARQGGWAALFLAMAQVLLGVVLVLANSVEGGVVLYHVAYTFFLLPHALFALPVLTALFPRLSRQHQGGDVDGFALSVGRGLKAIAYLTLPAAAGLVALADRLMGGLLFGESGGARAGEVAAVLVAFAPGVVGYGAFLFLARAFYAAGDTRTPALVHVGLTAVAAVAMVAATASLEGPGVIVGIAAVHAGAHLAAATLLAALLRWRVLAHRPLTGVGRSVARSAGAATLAGAVAAVAAAAIPDTGSVSDLSAVLAGGVLGAAAHLATHRLAGGMGPQAALALLRGSAR